MGRGKALAREDIAAISAISQSLKAELPKGATIGPDRLRDKLPGYLKRTYVRKVIPSIKGGASAADVTAAKKASMQWAEDKKKGSIRNAEKIASLLAKDKSTLQHSARLLAPNVKAARKTNST